MNLPQICDKRFWDGKKVLITGHTGFKGSWLVLLLKMMGAKTYGYALPPESMPNLYGSIDLAADLEFSEFGDIRDKSSLDKFYDTVNPDVVFHLAAQPLVRKSYQDPVETFEVNVSGTFNLLDCIRRLNRKRCSVVVITTDKCYENKEWVWGYREIDSLGGHDPYSASKACAELVSMAYKKSFFENGDAQNVFLASARAGNVIGGGDWSDDRLVPDVVRAIVGDLRLKIRYPKSIRPWQHVLDPLHGYLTLAQNLYNLGRGFSSPWNFGPRLEDCISVQEMLERFEAQWGAKLSVDISQEELHETTLLKLDCSKSRDHLGWSPKWTIKDALENTVDWYKDYYKNLPPQELKDITTNQIRKYLNNRMER